jgi:polyhydroxyalkanoate synthesis regulator phasin
MSERTKLLKKAVLAGVGASSNVDRVKAALNDVMQDLVKVGQDLFDELEDKGKVKADTVQNFMKNLQDEVSKRTQETEKKVSNKVGNSTRKAVKELGLVTREDYDELLERLAALEEAVGVSSNHEEEGEGKKRGRKKSQNN